MPELLRAGSSFLVAEFVQCLLMSLGVCYLCFGKFLFQFYVKLQLVFARALSFFFMTDAF